MTAAETAQAAETLERQARDAIAQGRGAEALALLRRVVALEPSRVPAWSALGRLSLAAGDTGAALEAFRRVADLDGGDPRHWIDVAICCERLGDLQGQEDALVKALTVDPYDLVALLHRGRLYERQGRTQRAATAYGAAAAVAPALDRLLPELRAPLQHAMRFHEAHQRRFAEFLDGALDPALRDVGAAGRQRFELALDILVGRKRRFDSQPMRLFMPNLLPVEFFERERFPWLDAFEQATDVVRQEFLSVLSSEDGFAPYIEYEPGQPVAQWAELNHNPRWSAFHLKKDGRPVAGNAERCPQTMALLATAPQPEQPGRTPVALFSLLRPHTRIPPHVGASNVRLLTHLPLIVPPGCSFRVGNTVREWVPGRAWVFDDTIEHEARNDSAQLRVIVIFDIWHPDLTAEERLLITRLNEAMNAFSTDAPAWEN